MLLACSVSDLKFVYSITNNKQQFDLEDLIWTVYCSRTLGTPMRFRTRLSELDLYEHESGFHLSKNIEV
jgi:hypothetical protein